MSGCPTTMDWLLYHNKSVMRIVVMTMVSLLNNLNCVPAVDATSNPNNGQENLPREAWNVTENECVQSWKHAYKY